MHIPDQLQRAVDQWANHQGISTEQFIIRALTEKIDVLSHHTEQQPQVTSGQLEQQPTLYRKEGLLVINAEWPADLDLDTYMDELREERILEQMAL